MAEQLPSHLQGLPKIQDWELVTEAYSDAEPIAFHHKANTVLRNNGLADDPATPSYLLLGNSEDDPGSRDGPRDRLETARNILYWEGGTNSAVLLEGLDPRNNRWDNCHLKFQFTLLLTAYDVLIAKDNDGGHELELGEIPLEDNISQSGSSHTPR